MKLEMRKKLAREPFEEKIRKVGQLLRLVKSFPKRPSRAPDKRPGQINTGRNDSQNLF